MTIELLRVFKDITVFISRDLTTSINCEVSAIWYCLFVVCEIPLNNNGVFLLINFRRNENERLSRKMK